MKYQLIFNSLICIILILFQLLFNYLRFWLVHLLGFSLIDLIELLCLVLDVFCGLVLILLLLLMMIFSGFVGWESYLELLVRFVMHLVSVWLEIIFHKKKGHWQIAFFQAIFILVLLLVHWVLCLLRIMDGGQPMILLVFLELVLEPLV